jgi:alpha-beta hydrolase superfamily lysophospholipase
MPEFTWWTGGMIDSLDTPDGRLAYRYWKEAQRAPKTLIGIHGFGGQNDNYIGLGEALKPDVAVYAIDLAGNGESGTRGDVESRAVHLRNLETLSALVRARHPNAKHFVAGYSLGAAYAALWAAQSRAAESRVAQGWAAQDSAAQGHQDFSGLILFAPPYRNVLTPPPAMRRIFNLWAAIMPTFRLRMDLRSDDSIDPRYVFAAQGERFIRRRTLRLLRVSMEVVAASKAALPDVKIPTLIVHGDADPVAHPGSARIAYYRIGASDKTLHWVRDAQHDLYDVLSGIKSSAVSDAQRALVVGPVRAWLETH